MWSSWMRSELSFFTMPELTEKALFAADSIRASTSEVSDTITAADIFTAVADSSLRWWPGNRRAANTPISAPATIAAKAPRLMYRKELSIVAMAAEARRHDVHLRRIGAAGLRLDVA